MKSKSKTIEIPSGSHRNLFKDFTMIIAGIICVIYLLNPDAGVLELIPDNIPVIGNLDEVAATILLLKVLKYFRWDVFRLFGKEKRGMDTNK